MEDKIVKKIFKVEGLSCSGCETRIENGLLKLEGIHKVQVSYRTGELFITFDSESVTLDEIKDVLEKMGYSIWEERKQRSEGIKEASKRQFIIIGIILLSGYFIIKNTVGFTFIPEVNANMGYGILFVVGLLSSLHCVAMCGGINLSLCISYETKDTANNQLAKLKPNFLYHAGRVISYTIIGGLVGALGSVFQMSNMGSALITILAGVFMIIMGLNMLNAFPGLRKLNPHLPKGLVKKVNGLKKGKGPFIVGLLNGFVPCGPLQAMQLYALGKGSFMAGALSMLLFSLGTVPVMFTFGVLGSMLSSKSTKNMIKVSAALVVLLGLVMMNRGVAFTGLSLETTLASGTVSEENISVVKDDVQEINTTLEAGSYPAITVQDGIPVVWTIQADKKSLNGCNNEIIIPKYNIRQKLSEGENVIQFTPTESGKFGYSCWMGMIKSSITVTTGDSQPDILYDPNSETDIDNTGLPSGCCG